MQHTLLNKKAGFTLIEFIVFLGILSAIIGITIPSISKTFIKNEKRKFELLATLVYNNVMNMKDEYKTPKTLYKNKRNYGLSIPYIAGVASVDGSFIDDVEYDVVVEHIIIPSLKKLDGFKEISYSIEKPIFSKEYERKSGKITCEIVGQGILEFETFVLNSVSKNNDILDFKSILFTSVNGDQKRFSL